MQVSSIGSDCILRCGIDQSDRCIVLLGRLSLIQVVDEVVAIETIGNIVLVNE